MNQADNASISPEKANTHSLYLLIMIRNGKTPLMATTVAPRPKLTKIIGMAQQTNVPVVANNVSQVTLLSPRRDGSVFNLLTSLSYCGK